jgi:hypothetical protein
VARTGEQPQGAGFSRRPTRVTLGHKKADALSKANREAAKAAWDAASRMDPTQRVSDIRKRYPLRGDKDVAKLAECFRTLGMPE